MKSIVHKIKEMYKLIKMKNCYSVLLQGIESVYFGLISLEMLLKKFSCLILFWSCFATTIACIVIFCAFVVELKRIFKIHYQRKKEKFLKFKFNKLK